MCDSVDTEESIQMGETVKEKSNTKAMASYRNTCMTNKAAV